MDWRAERDNPSVLSYLEEQPATLDVLRFLFMSIHEHVLTLPEMERGLRNDGHTYLLLSTDIV